ncbi:MAG: hypothetical protein WAV40_04535 [Microgenomates group bacterium]
MIQRISEPVSVVTTYNAQNRAVRPLSLIWGHHEYSVSQVGLRHTYRDGLTRHHIFSVVGGNLFFRLNLNADNLSWTLEEVSDGLPD